VQHIIFGGSFNPPHNGHLAMCLLLRVLFRPEIITLFVSKNPLKGNTSESTKEKSSAHDRHRLAMTRLFADDLNRTGNVFQVSAWELAQEKSYTIDTLNYLQTRHSPTYDSKTRIGLVIGEDNYKQFHLWKDYEKILAHVELIVFTRKAAEGTVPDIFRNTPVHHVALDVPVSSTAIRSGDLRDEALPSCVAAYIREHHLYTRK
jgi:nicotinate-nucleotide adenylyltransferase